MIIWEKNFAILLFGEHKIMIGGSL